MISQLDFKLRRASLTICLKVVFLKVFKSQKSSQVTFPYATRGSFSREMTGKDTMRTRIFVQEGIFLTLLYFQVSVLLLVLRSIKGPHYGLILRKPPDFSFL